MTRAAVHEARVPLRNPAPPRLSPAAPRVQRLCKDHGSGETCPKCAVQRKERSGTPGNKHAPEVDAVLASPGRPLPPGLRRDMEARFASDFSAVRIHDDAAGARAADAVDADAFAHGNHIAFGAGRFNPDSRDGRWLIAHELAHTVQQSRGSEGVQQAGGMSEGAFEREADMAASAALAFTPLPPLSAAPAGLARAPAPKKPVISTSSITVDGLTYQLGMISASTAQTGVAEPVAEFYVTPFYVPPKKGTRAIAMMQEFPPAPLLKVPKDAGGRAALKQPRENTGQLRDNWLKMAGWTAANADAQWRTCAGDPTTTFPKVDGKTCHMDHIMELQLGGGGNPENIQALDAGANISSGATIRARMYGLAFAMANDPGLNLGGATQDITLRLRFTAIKEEGEQPDVTKCQEVEKKALALAKAPAALAVGRQEHKLKLKTSDVTFSVKKDLSAKIRDDTDNHPQRLAYAGLILTNLGPPKSGVHKLEAEIDFDSRLPLKAGAASKGVNDHVALKVSKDKPPEFDKKSGTNLPIELLFLSPGKITEIDMTGEKLKWTGEITPTHKFLPKLTIVYADEKLTISSGLSEEQMKKAAPIPGAKITKAGIDIQLMPEFKPSGTLAFEYAVGERKIMEADVKVFPENNALAADGTVKLFIPGVKSAEGTVKYRAGAWSMSAKVVAGNIDLPYLKGGELVAAYAAGAFSAAGTLDLALPGNGTGQLQLSYAKSKWLFSGTGQIGHEKLGTIDVAITDDGETFTAEGKAKMGLEKLNLTADVGVKFKQKRTDPAPKLSGSGKLVLARKKLTGTLDVKLHESGAISAAGLVKYPVRDDLWVDVGIAVDEKQNVVTTGTATLTKPIDLFPRKGDVYKLTLLDLTIPIPGLSAGPIGLKFGIAAGIDASYGFGPGQLKDVKVGGTLHPFAPDPDPVLDLEGTLSVDANAGLAFWLKGSLVVDAGLAKATGYIKVSAGVEAVGNASLITKAHYAKGVFSVNAVARASASLDMKFTVAAGVELTTIFGSYGPNPKWEWKLAEFRVPTGLSFAFSAPIGYHSVNGLTLPSASNIKWEPPKKIDAGDLLKRMLTAATKKEPPK